MWWRKIHGLYMWCWKALKCPAFWSWYIRPALAGMSDWLMLNNRKFQTGLWWTQLCQKYGFIYKLYLWITTIIWQWCIVMIPLLIPKKCVVLSKYKMIVFQCHGQTIPHPVASNTTREGDPSYSGSIRQEATTMMACKVSVFILLNVQIYDFHIN